MLVSVMSQVTLFPFSPPAPHKYAFVGHQSRMFHLLFLGPSCRTVQVRIPLSGIRGNKTNKQAHKQKDTRNEQPNRARSYEHPRCGIIRHASPYEYAPRGIDAIDLRAKEFAVSILMGKNLRRHAQAGKQ